MKIPFLNRKKIEARADHATLTISLVPGGEMRVWSVSLGHGGPVSFSAAGGALIAARDGWREEIVVFGSDEEAARALRQISHALTAAAKPTWRARVWHFLKVALIVFALAILIIMWTKPSPQTAQRERMTPVPAASAPAGEAVPADELLK